MPWQANLQLDYRFDAPRTVLRHQHDGPLRILKSLYPEGDRICHNVVVHPPGGLVGGDTLDIKIHVGSGAHGLVSTPGATRFYASDDGLATTQHVALTLEADARLEWLPLEAIAYPGCQAHNSLHATLAEGAELLAWDVTALGLPNARQPFTHGCFSQRLELPGLWLERARIDATDTRLLDSPLGLNGQRCVGTLMLAGGSPFGRERREGLLEAARSALPSMDGDVKAGATCPNDRVLVVRAVAPVVEPLMTCLQTVWASLRPVAWGLSAQAPRIWQV
jgi:urease accessory protein